MARFDNKVVLVSGGARGQGAAEARLLVAQGAKVVIGDVLDNQGQSLAVELGPAASFVRHDVTSEADWARAVEAAEKLGGLHGLVNNAGIYQRISSLWPAANIVSSRSKSIARGNEVASNSRSAALRATSDMTAL
jgi:NAD(P)-dependent dehydrogenase (short-subunit alcohol dehydrogenase family)